MHFAECQSYEACSDELTDGYKPHEADLQQCFTSGFILTVLNWLLDGDVAIQGYGAQMHD